MLFYIPASVKTPTNKQFRLFVKLAENSWLITVFRTHRHVTVCTSYKDRVTKEEVCTKIQQAVWPHENLPTVEKRRKLRWCGHVSVQQIWPKPSCKAQWKGEEDQADRRRVGKTMSGNGQAWRSSSPIEQRRTEKNMVETGCEVICGAPRPSQYQNPCS